MIAVARASLPASVRGNDAAEFGLGVELEVGLRELVSRAVALDQPDAAAAQIGAGIERLNVDLDADDARRLAWPPRLVRPDE